MAKRFVETGTLWRTGIAVSFVAFLAGPALSPLLISQSPFTANNNCRTGHIDKEQAMPAFLFHTWTNESKYEYCVSLGVIT